MRGDSQMGAIGRGEIRRDDPLEGRGFLEEEPVPETAGESGETSLQDGEAGFVGEQASTEERARRISRETLSKPGAKEGDVLQDGALRSPSSYVVALLQQHRLRIFFSPVFN